jgi:hypothetical protein
MAEVAEPIVDTTPAAAPEEEEDEPVEVEVDELAMVEELEDYVAVGGATEIKLFGKWAFDDIEVRDISLVVRFNLVVGCCVGSWVFWVGTCAACGDDAWSYDRSFFCYHMSTSTLTFFSLFTIYNCRFLRITLPAKVITPHTYLTLPVDTPKNVSVKLRVLLWNDWPFV